MRKTMVIVLMIIVAAMAATADEGTVFERYPSAIGVHGTFMLEAGGLSYQHWFGPVGMQVTAGGQFTSLEDYAYSLQAGALYRIFSYDFSNWFSGGLYVLGLLGHVGKSDSLYGTSPTGYRPGFHVAAGIGIETVLFQHFSNDIQLFYYGATHVVPYVSIGVGGSFRYRF